MAYEATLSAHWLAVTKSRLGVICLYLFPMVKSGFSWCESTLWSVWVSLGSMFCFFMWAPHVGSLSCCSSCVYICWMMAVAGCWVGSRGVVVCWYSLVFLAASAFEMPEAFFLMRFLSVLSFPSLMSIEEFRAASESLMVMVG